MTLRNWLIIPLALLSCFAKANGFDAALSNFKQLYQQELGSVQECTQQQDQQVKLCSPALKNDGNAPYILHHGETTDKVVVLFHGLSDSPFYFKSIAKAIHQQGTTVVVGLLPGHGKVNADEDMEDESLANRWEQHVSKTVSLASALGEKLYVGGFSTGGALATQFTLNNPDKTKGLILFSGALDLGEKVESMADIWGINWLAKFLDGDYQTQGSNPFKYPEVSAYSSIELVEVIKNVRELLNQNGGIDTAIFAAHSAADTTTLLSGINHLMANNRGKNALFEISEKHDVCHADVVINEQQVAEIQFDLSKLAGEPDKCDVPTANPQHTEMLAAALEFLQEPTVN